MNVLVAAPHPDDDLIGCGGSIIGHLKKERNVSVAYLTSGDSGGIVISKSDPKLLRENVARQAASFLGIQHPICL